MRWMISSSVTSTTSAWIFGRRIRSAIPPIASARVTDSDAIATSSTVACASVWVVPPSSIRASASSAVSAKETGDTPGGVQPRGGPEQRPLVLGGSRGRIRGQA